MKVIKFSEINEAKKDKYIDTLSERRERYRNMINEYKQRELEDLKEKYVGKLVKYELCGYRKGVREDIIVDIISDNDYPLNFYFITDVNDNSNLWRNRFSVFKIISVRKAPKRLKRPEIDPYNEDDWGWEND